MFKKINSFFTITNASLIKRIIIVPLFLFFSMYCLASNYYFSSSIGNDSYTSTQAQNQATPWKSISKLNSFFSSIVAGDRIYFKRGDTFYGGIVATKSGSSAANPIVFADYGTGNLPVISGFTILTSWTSLGNNIYQTNLSAATSALNIVAINGVPQRMGRYPNYSATADPYLYYENFTSNSSGGTITDNVLTTSTNWTGADVVIRKKRWIMDRCKITGHSGGTLTYAQTNGGGGIKGFGYFIENDPRTLDQMGEWYYNTSTKNLQVHFGGSQPSTFSTKASTVSILMNLGAQKYITVQNLAFEGANVTGLIAQYGTDITIQKCSFSQIGQDGIIISGTPNTLLDNVSLNNILNNPVKIANNNVSNTIVRNSTITNCSLFAGMGANGDGNYQALSVQVNSGLTLQYNTINNVGYSAIDFQGNNATISNNFINNYCSVKDDGGGIYTWASNTAPIPNYYNRNIFSNIILNAIGAPFGTAGKTGEAKGIYMDGGSMNANIYDNSIAYVARTGILLNNSTNVKMSRNTIYSARFGIEMVKLFQTNNVRNIEMKKNILYPTISSQNAIYYKNFFLASPTPLTIEQDMKLIGKFDSNYYATPSTIGFSYYYCQNYNSNPSALTISPGYNMENWESLTAQDKSSQRPVKAATSINDLNFLYNASSTSKVVTFSGQSFMDVAGKVYNNSVTIPAWSSIILVVNGKATTTNSPPVANAGADKLITLPKDTTTLVGVGTDAGGTISSYSWLQLSGPSITIATPTTASTILNKLVQGTYQYQLTVTDNLGATDKDTVLVTVNAGSTSLPPSSLQPAVNPGNLVNGLDYTYYEGNWTALPAFSSLTPVKAGITTTFNLAPALKTSQYGFNFTGFINVPTDGQYTFYTSSDDGSSLYIDNVLTVTNDGIHGTVEKSGTIGLKAGFHTITGLFFQQAGGAVFTVSYSATGITKKTIPASVLFRSNLYPAVYPTGVINGLKYKYYEGNWNALPSFSSLTPIKTGTTTNFNLTLANKTIQYGFDFSGFITVPSDGQYTFYTSSDDGSNLYIDNVLTVSNDGVHGTVEKSGTIGLKAGKHYIKGLFFQQAGGAVFVVSYQGNGITKKAIPATSLFYTYNAVARIGSVTGSTDSVPSLSAINNTSTLTNLKITSFPNPTTTEFGLIVEGGTNEKIEVVVMNVEGQIVFKTAGTSNRKYKFGNSFMRGVYIIRVMQGNAVQMLKVIKG